MKTKTNIKSGIDTVPLPDRPSLRGWTPFVNTSSTKGIGTWPTPE